MTTVPPTEVRWGYGSLVRLARTGRWWHLLTAAVGLFALVAQLVLVVNGSAVLVPENPPPLAQRVLRFFSYFTIQSNILVLVCSITLVGDPQRDGPGWRVLRQCAMTGIVVTGIVHFVLLRPLLHLTGWHYATDKLLHLVIPSLAVVGWLLFGPRARVTWRAIGYGVLWPIGWLLYTLVVGAVTGWYPYPFLDVSSNGAARVGVVCLVIAALFFALAAVLLLLDRRLPGPCASAT